MRIGLYPPHGEAGGFRTDDDAMSVTASFIDSADSPLGSLTIGPVTAADRGNRTVLLPRSASQAVPIGTRRIIVRLDAIRANGSYNDAYADNVELNLITGDLPPDTHRPPDSDPPETEIDKGPKTKTEKSKAKIAYSASEPATFQCAQGLEEEPAHVHRLRRRKVKYRHLKPGKKSSRCVRSTPPAMSTRPRRS